MSQDDSKGSASSIVSGSFPSTHWSAVLAAGESGGASADRALAELCRTYWYPLYAFARRKGHEPTDAEDSTQGFFAHLIEARLVRKADPQKGRFRSFMLGCFQLFLGKEAERATTSKRGGGSFVVSIDSPRAERRLSAELASNATPEQLFDRNWAVATLDAALAALETEMKESGRADLFAQLLPKLEGDGEEPGYAELARSLGTTEATIKMTVHRLRRRYRELIHAAVSHTLNDPRDVEAELAHLLAALRG